MKFCRIERGGWGWALAGIALLTLFAGLLHRYVGLEQEFYHWDHALYPGMAQALETLRQSQGWGAVGAALHASLNDDFSQLFTLPSLLAFALTGDAGRATYIVANFLAYGGGLALLLAFLLRQMLSQIPGQMLGWRLAPLFFLMLAVLLGCNFAWTSLVEGYPDLGGALLLALALALLLARWPQLALGHSVAAGMVLALAILFRRHFIYPSAVLLLVIGGLQLVYCWRQRAQGGAALRPLLNVLLTGWALAAMLWGLAPQFVERLITMNYPALYASYAETSAAVLDKGLSRIGAMSLLLALAGYALAWRQAAWRPRLQVYMLFFLGWGALWFGWVRFGGQHYLSQILPIILPLGWALLLVALWHAGRWQRLGGLAIVVFLATQALSGFWFAENWRREPSDSLTERQWFAGLLAETRPPRMRDDYTVIEGLVADLAASLRPLDKVAVLASSPVFNQDILLAAVIARRQAPGNTDFIPLAPMPDVDRRDALPLDAINQATVLLLVTPPQYHLRPEGQRVVGSAITLLTQDMDFVAHWRPDEKRYPLEQGAVLTIWRLQQPWTPAQRAQMLRRLRQLAASSGSLPQDWVTQESYANLRSYTDTANRTRVEGMLVPVAPPTILFFTPVLSWGTYRVQGTMQSACAAQITATALRATGDTLMMAQSETAGAFNIVLSVPKPTPFYVQLSLQSQGESTAAPCAFSISDLVVVPEK